MTEHARILPGDFALEGGLWVARKTLPIPIHHNERGTFEGDEQFGVLIERSPRLPGSVVAVDPTTGMLTVSIKLRSTVTITDDLSDHVPPAPSQAWLAGTALSLVFDEPLDEGSVPSPGAFVVEVEGAARAVSAVAVDGATVALTLASAPAAATVSYLAPAHGAAILDLAGNAAAGFVRHPVRDVGARAWVSAVTFVSAPAADGIYGEDEVVEVRVAFTEAVEVSGAPELVLEVGTAERRAAFLRDDGAAGLVFAYEVSDSDYDGDGVEALSVQGGEIEAERAFSPVRGGFGQRVNGGGTPFIRGIALTSTPREGGVYGADERVEVTLTFNEPVVTVQNDGFHRPEHLPYVSLEVGAKERSARYRRGSGSARLVFDYLLESDDFDADGVSVAAGGQGSLDKSQATVKDLDGNDVETGFDGFGNQAGHRVDGGPRIVGLALSPPANGHTYGLGETIEATLRYSRAVSAPVGTKLKLRIGDGDAVLADRTGGGAREETYAYVVGDDDVDRDGVSIPADPFTPYHVTASDGTRVDANFDGAGPFADRKVDGAGPRVEAVSVVSSPASGDTYRRGETIRAAVAFDEPVFLVGPATVDLFVGGSDHRRSAAYVSGSGTATLYFTYEVAAGDADPNGVSIEHRVVAAYVSGLRDEAGNDAVFDADPDSTRAAGHKVDGSQSPSGSQPPIPDPHEVEIWRATMTVAVLDNGGIGFWWGEGYDEFQKGELTDRTFTFKGRDYAIWSLSSYSAQGRIINLNFDGTSTAAVPPTAEGNMLRLFADDRVLAFSDGSRSTSPNYNWQWGRYNGPALTDWSADDEVELVLYARRARVSSVGVHSRPASGDVYRDGETIVAEARFSQDVEVDETNGSPTLALGVGGELRTAAYTGMSGNRTLRFAYAVGPDDLDHDGVSIPANALSPGGAVFTTTHSGLGAAHATGALGPQSGHQVDGASVGAAAAALTGIEAVSDPGPDGFYSIGEAIVVRLAYSAPVHFAAAGAAPELVLDVGGERRVAAHQGPSGLAALTFAYPVAPGDDDADGVGVAENGLTLPAGATLRDDFGRVVALAHAAKTFPGHRVQDVRIVSAAIVSAPLNAINYLPPETIEVALRFIGDAGLPAPVEVSGGAPTLGIEVGGAARRARYVRGSGSAELVFAYEVGPADTDGDGVSVPANGLALEGAAIVDAGGAAVPLGHAGLGPQGAHRVGRPVVVAAEVVSDPGEDGVYTAGEPLDVAIVFSEPVTGSSSGAGARLALDLGGEARSAAAHSAAGDRLVFRYVVAEADADPDGVGLVHNALVLGAGTTIDAFGRSALVDLAAREYRAHRVHGDGTGPAVAIASRPANGANYVPGETVEVSATFAHAVEFAGGAPTIDLEVGGTERRASYARGSGTATLVFTYAVGRGERDDDGASVPADSLALGDGALGFVHAPAAAFTGHAAVEPDAMQRVGGAQVAGIEVTSDPGAGGGYAVGERIHLQARFTAPVTITGGPLELDLAVGATTHRLTMTASAPLTTDLVPFSHLVQAEDFDFDGVRVAADALRLGSGAAVESAGGRSGELFHSEHAFPAHRVGTVAVAAIASSPKEDSHYEEGETIEVSLAFAVPVAVFGTPTIGIEIGAETRRAAYVRGSDTETLAFAYEVVREDRDTNGVSVPADDLDLGEGGAIVFADGAAQAYFGHAGLGRQSGHKVGKPYIESITIASDPGTDGVYEGSNVHRGERALQRAHAYGATWYHADFPLRVGSETLWSGTATNRDRPRNTPELPGPVGRARRERGDGACQLVHDGPPRVYRRGRAPARQVAPRLPFPRSGGRRQSGRQRGGRSHLVQSPVRDDVREGRHNPGDGDIPRRAGGGGPGGGESDHRPRCRRGRAHRGAEPAPDHQHEDDLGLHLHGDRGRRRRRRGERARGEPRPQWRHDHLRRRLGRRVPRQPRPRAAVRAQGRRHAGDAALHHRRRARLGPGRGRDLHRRGDALVRRDLQRAGDHVPQRGRVDDGTYLPHQPRDQLSDVEPCQWGRLGDATVQHRRERDRCRSGRRGGLGSSGTGSIRRHARVGGRPAREARPPPEAPFLPGRGGRRTQRGSRPRHRLDAGERGELPPGGDDPRGGELPGGRRGDGRNAGHRSRDRGRDAARRVRLRLRHRHALLRLRGGARGPRPGRAGRSQGRGPGGLARVGRRHGNAGIVVAPVRGAPLAVRPQGGRAVRDGDGGPARHIHQPGRGRVLRARRPDDRDLEFQRSGEGRRRRHRQKPCARSRRGRDGTEPLWLERPVRQDHGVGLLPCRGGRPRRGRGRRGRRQPGARRGAHAHGRGRRARGARARRVPLPRRAGHRAQPGRGGARLDARRRAKLPRGRDHPGAGDLPRGGRGDRGGADHRARGGRGDPARGLRGGLGHRHALLRLRGGARGRGRRRGERSRQQPRRRGRRRRLRRRRGAGAPRACRPRRALGAQGGRALRHAHRDRLGRGLRRHLDGGGADPDRGRVQRDGDVERDRDRDPRDRRRRGGADVRHAGRARSAHAHLLLPPDRGGRSRPGRGRRGRRQPRPRGGGDARGRGRARRAPRPRRRALPERLCRGRGRDRVGGARLDAAERGELPRGRDHPGRGDVPPRGRGDGDAHHRPRARRREPARGLRRRFGVGGARLRLRGGARGRGRRRGGGRGEQPRPRRRRHRPCRRRRGRVPRARRPRPRCRAQDRRALRPRHGDPGQRSIDRRGGGRALHRGRNHHCAGDVQRAGAGGVQGALAAVGRRRHRARGRRGHVEPECEADVLLPGAGGRRGRRRGERRRERAPARAGRDASKRRRPGRRSLARRLRVSGRGGGGRRRGCGGDRERAREPPRLPAGRDHRGERDLPRGGHGDGHAHHRARGGRGHPDRGLHGRLRHRHPRLRLRGGGGRRRHRRGGRAGGEPLGGRRIDRPRGRRGARVPRACAPERGLRPPGQGSGLGHRHQGRLGARPGRDLHRGRGDRRPGWIQHRSLVCGRAPDPRPRRGGRGARAGADRRTHSLDRRRVFNQQSRVQLPGAGGRSRPRRGERGRRSPAPRAGGDGAQPGPPRRLARPRRAAVPRAPGGRRRRGRGGHRGRARERHRLLPGRDHRGDRDLRARGRGGRDGRRAHHRARGRRDDAHARLGADDGDHDRARLRLRGGGRATPTPTG